MPTLQPETVTFEQPIERESSNIIMTRASGTRASGSDSSDPGDWIIKAKSSTGSFRRASSFRNSSFSVSYTPSALVSPGATSGILLGLPNNTPEANAKKVEKLKRRHSISLADTQRLHFNQGLEGMIPNEILLRNQIASIKPLSNIGSIGVMKPKVLPDAQETIPMEEIGKNLIISNAIEVEEPPLLQYAIPDTMSKSPNFRRRHSVSGTRSFSRPEYMSKLGAPGFGIESIEERKSIFLDKSIFMDKE
jgi:hypothetical protein